MLKNSIKQSSFIHKGPIYNLLVSQMKKKKTHKPEEIGEKTYRCFNNQTLVIENKSINIQMLLIDLFMFSNN